MVETEDLLQEVDGAEFADSLNNLWRAVQALDVDPANTVNMNTLISRASEFVNRAKAVYEGLTNYQANMDKTIDGIVKTINEYGDRIMQLNQEIVSVESGHREHANDLRDERNLLLDKLGELGKIEYDEDIFGNVSVYFESVPFVMTDHVNHMGVDRLLESSQGYATPYWEYMATTEWNPVTDDYTVIDISNAKVFDLKQEVSSVAGTDIGKLRSTLLARGDHNATYHDIMGGEETDVNGDPLHVDPEFVQNFYNKNIRQSILMNVEAEFDQLIHNVVEEVNRVIENAASNPARKNPEMYVEPTLADVRQELIDHDAELVAAGKTPVFSNIPDAEKDDYVYQVAMEKAVKQFDLFTLVNDTKAGVVRYDIGERAVNGQLEGYPAGTIRIGTTTMNLSVNEMLIRNPSLLSMRDIEGNEDKKMTEALKQVFRNESYTLNPTVATKTNLMDYYNSLVGQVANSGDVYDSITDQQTATVNAIRDARDQIVSVSSDEELEFMIKFQNAYNAASRYINVVSEMLEHIVSTLGS
ncbi:MAG: hypothetical protein K5696_02425 [Lachnospiraceae bacterium]|nr:hypothetical protein [Lachnospiraceae bacterium]